MGIQKHIKGNKLDNFKNTTLIFCLYVRNGQKRKENGINGLIQSVWKFNDKKQRNERECAPCIRFFLLQKLKSIRQQERKFQKVSPPEKLPYMGFAYTCAGVYCLNKGRVNWYTNLLQTCFPFFPFSQIPKY